MSEGWESKWGEGGKKGRKKDVVDERPTMFEDDGLVRVRRREVEERKKRKRKKKKKRWATEDEVVNEANDDPCWPTFAPPHCISFFSFLLNSFFFYLHHPSLSLVLILIHPLFFIRIKRRRRRVKVLNVPLFFFFLYISFSSSFNGF